MAGRGPHTEAELRALYAVYLAHLQRACVRRFARNELRRYTQRTAEDAVDAFLHSHNGVCAVARAIRRAGFAAADIVADTAARRLLTFRYDVRVSDGRIVAVDIEREQSWLSFRDALCTIAQ